MASGLRPGTRIRLIIGEELIHAAHFCNLRELWKNGRNSIPFRNFVSRHHRDLFSDLKKAIESAPPKERKLLTEAIQASYHAYFSQLKSQIPPKIAKLDTVLRDISDTPELTRFIHEFLRQVVQLKHQGQVSESVAEKIFPLIHQTFIG
jgi:hypothetical protein